MQPLLSVFPHPDDETFTAAGTLAAAAAQGIPVVVVSATRGEAGESSVPGLDDPDRLGEVRAQELRDAMSFLGISDVRFLGYRDSGMPGSAAADHPAAFVRSDPEEAAARIAALIRELRPQAVVTFGPEGMYGHPDHLHMHHVTVLAVTLAANLGSPLLPADSEPWETPALYFGTFPREDMLDLLDRPGSPLAFLPPDARSNLGTPRADITHVVDITPWSEAKRAAIAAHATQTAPGGPLQHIPLDAIERQVRREYFVRASLPWSSSSGAAHGVVASLAAAGASG